MLVSLERARPPALDAITRPAQPTPVPGSRAWVLEGEESGVRIFRNAGGVPMLVHTRPGAIAQLGWFVRGGASDEPPLELGLTTMMTRTSLKGTERRSAQRIAEDSEFLGGVLSAAASTDGFQWTISVPARRIHEAVELLADVVQRPSFPEDAVDAERAVALANLASLRDDMYRWPMRLATEAAWGAHPYGRSVLGTESSLAAMTGAKLRQWHENVALEARGVLVCVGDVDPDEIASLCARFFGRLQATTVAEINAPLWPRTFIQRADARDKAQSALAMMFEGPSRADDDRFAAAMIAGVTSGLGGRFFDTLRDKQSLAYTVMASAVPRRHAGAFAAYIATSPEKEEAARSGLLAEFAKLCDQPVTEAELTQAKTYALGTWAIRRESAGAVMGDIADSWLFGASLAELAQYEARVRRVTAADMLRVARRYFDPDRRVEGVVRGTGRSGA
jgi:zinc protease